MKPAPEKYRLIRHPFLGSDATYGNNGMFIIPHYKILDYEIYCQISDGEGWEHVSVTIARKKEKPSRCPTWQEMCFIKDLFWNKDETVIQFHPPESEYVNNHPFCLHLWKPLTEELPLPPNIFVGVKGLTL